MGPGGRIFARLGSDIQPKARAPFPAAAEMPVLHTHLAAISMEVFRFLALSSPLWLNNQFYAGCSIFCAIILDGFQKVQYFQVWLGGSWPGDHRSCY